MAQAQADALGSEAEQAAPTVDAAWTPAHSPWLIAIAVMAATFLEVLDSSVANVALPNIAGNLSASSDEATWVLTSYLVSNAIVLPATNWLSRMFGRKRFLIACIVVFTLSSFLCGAAQSLAMLVIARIIQGAGGGALQPISQAVLLESFPKEKRGTAMGMFGMGVVVAPILGPTLGGWITDNFSWRWVFYINLPIGILAILMTQAFVEDPPYVRKGSVGRIDYWGFGLMALWLATLQIILDKGQEVDWFSTNWMILLAVVSAVCMAGFIFRELSTPEPIVDLRVFKDRNFAIGTLLMTIMGAVLYSATAALPLFLQNLLGYPAMQSGLAVSPRGIGAFLMMTVVGRMVGVIDSRVLISSGFFILGYATFLLSNITLQVGVGNIAWPNIITGAAMGLIFVPLTTTSMATLSNDKMGNATGLFNLMRNIGGGLGISLATTYLARDAQSRQSQLSAHLSFSDPAFQARFHAMRERLLFAHTSAVADRMALGSLYRGLVGQATLLSFVDVFRWTALLCLFCIPVVWLIGRGRKPSGPVMMH